MNANATAQVIQSQLPPLPPCQLWYWEDGRWWPNSYGDRQTIEGVQRNPAFTYAIVTITPPMQPASDEEIHKWFLGSDASKFGEDDFTKGYKAAERQLGVRE